MLRDFANIPETSSLTSYTTGVVLIVLCSSRAIVDVELYF
jgi:hypothetical protein